MNENALRIALYRALNVSVDEPCPATQAAFDRLVDTRWVSRHNMLESLSEPYFPAKEWVFESCGYFDPELMNSDFKRLTGKTREEWLALCGFS